MIYRGFETNLASDRSLRPINTATNTVDGEASPVTARKDRKSKQARGRSILAGFGLSDPPPHFFTAPSSHTRGKRPHRDETQGFFLAGNWGTTHCIIHSQPRYASTLNSAFESPNTGKFNLIIPQVIEWLPPSNSCVLGRCWFSRPEFHMRRPGSRFLARH